MCLALHFLSLYLEAGGGNEHLSFDGRDVVKNKEVLMHVGTFLGSSEAVEDRDGILRTTMDGGTEGVRNSIEVLFSFLSSNVHRGSFRILVTIDEHSLSQGSEFQCPGLSPPLSLHELRTPPFPTWCTGHQVGIEGGTIESAGHRR